MIKRLSILLSILCLFVADVGWATSKTSQPVGNIYYLRADGTAANKAAATGPSYDATKCMSVAIHNAQTFSGGDIICISSQGGTYTRDSSPNGIIAPSSGSDGNPIVYAAAPGETPVIDRSWNKTKAQNAALWAVYSGGVYVTTSYYYGRVLWEDGEPLAAQDAGKDPATLTAGQWLYNAGYMYYYPTTGTPANHDLATIWWENDLSPGGIDIRDKSNIEVSGLTLNRSGILTGNNPSSPANLIKNISIHNNVINYFYWAIYGNLVPSTTPSIIQQDTEIYNNVINYCNSGISIWNSSSMIAHTQHPIRINVHNNTINYLNSITPTSPSLNWGSAILNPSWWEDHEGISFQDAVECTIADNYIMTVATKLNDWSPNFNRAIFLYVNPGLDVSWSGNKILRNRCVGTYSQAIYLNGGIDYSNNTLGAPGWENNIIADNVLQSNYSNFYNIGIDFAIHPNNTATGMNYCCNNTINYTEPASNNHLWTSWGFYGSGSDGGNWTFSNNIIKSTYPVMIETVNSNYAFSHNNYYAYDSSSFYANGGYGKDWATWQGYGYDISGSYYGYPGSSPATNPNLRAADSALTSSSPSWCKNVGTPIEGITVIDGAGQLGIDGKAFDPEHPSVGAYAQPVNPIKPALSGVFLLLLDD